MFSMIFDDKRLVGKRGFCICPDAFTSYVHVQMSALSLIDQDLRRGAIFEAVRKLMAICEQCRQ